MAPALSDTAQTTAAGIRQADASLCISISAAKPKTAPQTPNSLSARLLNWRAPRARDVLAAPSGDWLDNPMLVKLQCDLARQPDSGAMSGDASADRTG